MKKLLTFLAILALIALLICAGIFIYDYFYYEDSYYEYDDDMDDDDAYYDEDAEYEDEYYEDDDQGLGWNILSFIFGDDDETYDVEDSQDSVDYDDGGQTVYQHQQQDSLVQLTVLLSFRDQELETSEDQWSKFYFANSNSVSAYYAEMSKGRFGIVPANETYGAQNNGVIVVDIDRKHPNLTSESSDREYEACTEIFEEMLDAVDEYIDFGQYDSNGDGNVLANELCITMIAAGYEENDYTYDENQVAGICINEDKYIQVDGVGIGDYILCGELDTDGNGNDEIVTIGVACHETGHVLGLPDLYDTDYSSIGLGFHSLMSEGNNNRVVGQRIGSTPSPLIAWSREYVGFVESTEIDTDGVYTLYGQSTDEYNVLKIDADRGYYLIENVDFGEYGAGISEYMEHSGIAVWYIDERVVTDDNIWNNVINTEDRDRGVQLVEAAGRDDLYEESLDYDNPDYDHYFAKGFTDQYTTDDGMVISVLDAPGRDMRVEIEGLS